MCTELSTSDAVVAKAWGYSDWAWCALSNEERAQLRDRVASAPALNTPKES